MFSKNLSRLRKQANLTQYQLAERLKFSRGQLANYEQGKREPDYETLWKIADYFDITIDQLLGRQYKDVSDHFSEAEAIMFKDIEGFNDLPEEKQEEIRRTINEQIEFLVHKQKRDS